MLLMVQKGISSGMCHSIYQYAKANSKYVKDYKENKEVSYLHYWDVTCLLALSAQLWMSLVLAFYDP